MAREQERDLREFLFDAGPAADRGGAADVGPRLRAAAARFEDAYGGRVDVVLAPDLPHLDGARADALAGAVGEALNNAGKHGRATRVTVYAEPDRYRDISDRRALLMNAEDLVAAGLEEGQSVELTSHWRGETRRLAGFRAHAYDLPRGCAAAYFPEANALVPLGAHSARSGTPAKRTR
jgi:hypothetical protein